MLIGARNPNRRFLAMPLSPGRLWSVPLPCQRSRLQRFGPSQEIQTAPLPFARSGVPEITASLAVIVVLAVATISACRQRHL